MNVVITVDTHLRFSAQDLPAHMVESIKAALTWKNVEKANAKKEDFWGWQNLPDTIQAWELTPNGTFILPRGFAVSLKKGFDRLKIEIVWIDNRGKRALPSRLSPRVALRDYQEDAVETIVKVQQGIWQAPTGAGKTVGVLEAMRRLNRVSLVIVNKLEIAQQWQKRSIDFLGVPMGLVGDGVMDVQDFTVCMQQTLWARYDELEESGFFSLFGFVCLDECHHLPAQTFTKTLQSFDAEYRIGVSATPDKDPALLGLMKATLGNIFHKTDKQRLRAGGFLVTPEVCLVPTGFNADFWPTHPHDPAAGALCDWSPMCTRSNRQRTHRNNYTEVVGELQRDISRNELIARDIMVQYNSGHACLVFSDRLEHLKELRRRCCTTWVGVNEDDMIMFTGEQTMEERGAIQERCDRGSVVLFSTVADEALDIPRLDRGFFVWPTRNAGIVEQRLGRFERCHPSKEDAIIFDYVDDVKVMRGQAKDRLKVYTKQGLQVTGGSVLAAWSRRVTGSV